MPDDLVQHVLARLGSDPWGNGPPGISPTPVPVAGELRPPAADLADYTRDLPGNGPIVATIDTSLGAIHCTLLANDAPMAVANFIDGDRPGRRGSTRPPEPSRRTTASTTG